MARSRSTRITPRRPAGDGSVSPRTKTDGTVVYDAYWTYSDPLTGKVRRSCRRGFPTRAEGAAFLRAQTSQVDAGSFVPASTEHLGSYLDMWLGTLRLRRQTVQGYRNYVTRHINPRIGHLTLAELTPMHLNALYAELERNGNHSTCCRAGKKCGIVRGTLPLSRSSVRQVHSVLSASLGAAVDAGLLSVSPTMRAKPPTQREARAERKSYETWTPEELATFLDGCRGHRFHPLWQLLAMTGMRRGEALGLRWADVDLELGTASVQQTVGSDRDESGNRRTFVQHSVKNGRPHMIALDVATVAVLRTHRLRQNEVRLALGPQWVDHDLVFAPDDGWLHQGVPAGGPLPTERVSSLWREMVRRQPGVRTIRLHDLRHTWATLALKSGVHPKVVQERLNHSTISVTLGMYSHTTPGMDREACDLVASLLVPHLRQPA